MHTRNIGPSPFLAQTNTNILVSPSERTGRKSYKLSNRKGGERKEAVWPPQLEAALLEGLRKYKPISKSGRPLRRFTKRNVSISRHIFAVTGKTRTAKQVGSRLQQITESTKDEEIIRLITSREVILDTHDSQDAQSSYSEADSSKSDGYVPTSPPILNTPSSSVTPSEPGSPQITIPSDQVSLFAQLLSTDTNSLFHLGLDADIPNTGINLFLNVDPTEGLYLDGNSLSNARRLSNIPSSHLFEDVPTLSISSFLLSPALSHACTSSVYLDAVKIVHSEQVVLVPVKSESTVGAYMYVAPLLSSYWHTLVHRGSIERYTIILEIMELDCGVTVEAGRRKFSIAINMKLNTEEAALPSRAPYYPTTTYDNIHIQTEYPDLPLANHLPTASYLPDISMQMSSNFQNEPAMSAWNDNNYFIPTTTYVQYPELGDSRYQTHLESDHPSYPYPVF